jgi:predicted TPR repeat methyltransferase
MSCLLYMSHVSTWECQSNLLYALTMVLTFENVCQHALSALVADPAITTASNAYIKSLFDEYAATFDKALVGVCV